ncbi:hypothetical protein CLV44_11996 [Marinobacterium halophilum]|uniref:Uncharacterized protein n=2 Tax=Marinobacterium halophilum TaxID=267374 RepID=A0A2P8ERZ8_9GAMM|nr:hypothetical protein CLV44_11996 [Marinobacterium halophilum]
MAGDVEWQQSSDCLVFFNYSLKIYTLSPTVLDLSISPINSAHFKELYSKMSDFNRMVMTQNGLVDVDYYVEQARRERSEFIMKGIQSLYRGLVRMLKPRRPLTGASALVH